MTVFKDFYFRGFDSSSNFHNIEIFPEFEFIENRFNGIEKQRSITGALNRFNKVGYSKYKYIAELRFISNSDAYVINNWYENKLPFSFSIDDEHLNVIITNNFSPISTRSKKQYDLYTCKVYFESKETGVKENNYFTLDSPIWGKLDQTYNPLY